jgi:hypothetical protein
MKPAVDLLTLRGNNARLRISEDSVHRGLRAKTSEGIRIAQPPRSLLWGSHANMFADFSTPANPREPASTPLPSRFIPSNYPHDFLNTPFSFLERRRTQRIMFSSGICSCPFLLRGLQKQATLCFGKTQLSNI